MVLHNILVAMATYNHGDTYQNVCFAWQPVYYLVCLVAMATNMFDMFGCYDNQQGHTWLPRQLLGYLVTMAAIEIHRCCGNQ